MQAKSRQQALTIETQSLECVIDQPWHCHIRGAIAEGLAVGLVGRTAPADPIVRFEDGHAKTSPAKINAGRKSGGTRSDDHHYARFHASAPTLRKCGASAMASGNMSSAVAAVAKVC
jgi:hypothetical protein